MVTGAELFALSKTYPIISVIIGLLLFIIGFKVAKKLMWSLAVVAVIAAVVMLFF
tara:strand:- start:74 stop:238 length:165 start_codon:yes stop_codon:yes gene_type:complete